MKDREALAQSLAQQLQLPYWDPVKVENCLNALWQTIQQRAYELHEHDFTLPIEQAKVQAAEEILNSAICSHPAVIEFLAERGEYAVMKSLSAEGFADQVKICLGKIEELSRYTGDDYLYFQTLEKAGTLFTAMDASERENFQLKLDPLLTSPTISFTLFIFLAALASPAAQSNLLGFYVSKWKEDFLTGLRTGDLGRLHDSLFYLAHEPFKAIIQNEISSWPEIWPYQEALLSINSIPSLADCMEEVVKQNFERRLKQISSLDKPAEEIKQLIASIEGDDELGSCLHKLCLIEELILAPHDSALKSRVALILALESQNLSNIEKALDATGLKPWDRQANGDTLIGMATQLVICKQLEGQRILKGHIDSSSKEECENFYFAFHQMVQRLLPADHWQLAMEALSQAAFKANGVYMGKNTSLFFGKWDLPDSIYNRLFKIYLPVDEHGLWTRYCIKPSSQELKELLQDAYQGNQETYGLWFHLMHKVMVEKLAEFPKWQPVFLQMGFFRKLVALFLMNIQIPRGHAITLAARKQQETIDKIWPGSPLNFGVPDSEWNPSHTTMLNEMRGHYLEKTRQLMEKFEERYQTELSSGALPKHAYQGREFLVYPHHQQLGYAVACPFSIESQRVTGVQILWNFPAPSTFIYPGHLPKRVEKLPLDFNPFWLHPSGADKQKMLAELDALFGHLLRADLPDYDRQLGRFFYIFFQAVPYKRGSASIGLVLLSALLALHGRMVPDAPPPPYFLDCEAMCSTEEEFIEWFCKWISGAF